MKIFKSSYYFAYILIEMVKKVHLVSPNTFDHFAGRSRGCLIVCCFEFLYLFECFSLLFIFFNNIVGSFYLERC